MIRYDKIKLIGFNIFEMGWKHTRLALAEISEQSLFFYLPPDFQTGNDPDLGLTTKVLSNPMLRSKPTSLGPNNSLDKTHFQILGWLEMFCWIHLDSKCSLLLHYKTLIHGGSIPETPRDDGCGEAPFYSGGRGWFRSWFQKHLSESWDVWSWRTHNHWVNSSIM